MVSDFPGKIIVKQEGTIKADVDQKLQVTAWGGLALIEHLARRTGLWRDVAAFLPQRVKRRGYSTVSVVSSVIYGLLQGGRGFQAAEVLRNDESAKRMLGLHDGIPEEATVYRAMCDLAGLNYRAEEETYQPPATRAPALIEEIASSKRGRRVVGEPEPANPENLECLHRLLRRQAARHLPGLPKTASHIGEYLVVFGDATQLEVTGRCFDAAETDYNENRSLQWLTMWAGPLLVSSQVRGGARDEGTAMSGLIAPVDREVTRPIDTPSRKVLALLDRAYGEVDVLAELDRVQWRYVVGLSSRETTINQVKAQPHTQWVQLGARPERGWLDTAVCAFHYMAETWAKARTVVALRYLPDGKLWKEYEYRFVVTNLEPGDLKGLCQQWNCGYAETLWRLYDLKQGRENQFKTALSDLGLHHPPSGRLGCNEVFYLIACLAVNLAMCLSWVGVAEEHRGMRLWRMRPWYFAVAVRVRRHAGRIYVWLSGAVNEVLQRAWLGAFERITAVW